MINNGFQHFADALVFVHGPFASGEAARQALLCERTGDIDTAAYWRKLQRELALRGEMKSARQVA